MTEQRSPEDLARQRFLVLTMLRLSGVGIAVFGMAILAGKIDFPAFGGYALVVIGTLEALIMPLVLGKSWKSPPP